MAGREHIDDLLRKWPYRPGNVIARRVRGHDGRELLQMRVDMGLLQMEVAGRPDGERPGGSPTVYDMLSEQARDEGASFVLSEDQCDEIDREFVQFYHRRICWLALREFRRAQQDADHTLRLMDFSTAHSPDEQWALSHEQYRPFVMFHRAQAAALADLEELGPEAAIEAIDSNVRQIEDLYAQYEIEEELEDDELVGRLEELKSSIREHFHVGPTLAEALADAVAAEQYERAAEIRDEIRRRKEKGKGKRGKGNL